MGKICIFSIMLYLLETKLPENKSIFFALINIYGIKKSIAFFLCKKIGFSENLKTRDLTQSQFVQIVQLIKSLNLTLNNDLKKFKSLALKNLISIKSYNYNKSFTGVENSNASKRD